MTEETLDLAPLDELLQKLSTEGQGLIPVLQQAQELYGYLPKEVLNRTAEIMGLPESQVLGVASFYSQFHLEPRGRHIIQQCDGTACHVRGSNKIIAAIEDHSRAIARPGYKLHAIRPVDVDVVAVVAIHAFCEHTTH